MPEITRPVGLEPGRQTAQWVLDTITALPEQHDQADWETRHDDGGNVNECGTTRCVGGWALWAHGYRANRLDNAVKAAELLGLDTMMARFTLLDDEETEVCDYDAETLFYHTNNWQAVEALRYLARGEAIDWVALGVEEPEARRDG